MTDPACADPARVTVVIATYGRPDALVCAVQSVFLQTVQDWRLLVIGDACDESAECALAPFLGDPRVCFVNLPWRCGEQALPNSAGMAAATTEYVALLNHDDVWFPRHLEVALQTLVRERADLFIGRAVASIGLDESGLMPVLSSAAGTRRALRTCFWRRYADVEPASAWVFSRRLANEVGPWRAARELYRTPIEDWALRIWRSGVGVVGSEVVSVLKANKHNVGGSVNELDYATPAAEQGACVAALEDPVRRETFDREVQTFADSGLARAKRHRRYRRALWQGSVSLFVNPLTATFFRWTGCDAFSLWCRLVGMKPGDRWRKSLRRRTGEVLQDLPDQEVVKHYVRAHASPEQAF